jgi:acetyl-CoA carboxylase biotin carboxylase subunit
MNTRLQVEHPISEMVSGIDIVREQLRIADGAPLGYRQAEIRLSGHAVECRINAENPETFRPSPGRIADYHPPGGLGVRVDSALYQGYRVPPYYDSLIAKLIVHGKTRNECLMRLRRALDEYVIGGIDTTIALHRRLVDTPEFIDGAYDIGWLERFLGGAGRTA